MQRQWSSESFQPESDLETDDLLTESQRVADNESVIIISDDESTKDDGFKNHHSVIAISDDDTIVDGQATTDGNDGVLGIITISDGEDTNSRLEAKATTRSHSSRDAANELEYCIPNVFVRPTAAQRQKAKENYKKRCQEREARILYRVILFEEWKRSRFAAGFARDLEMVEPKENEKPHLRGAANWIAFLVSTLRRVPVCYSLREMLKSNKRAPKRRPVPKFPNNIGDSLIMDENGEVIYCFLEDGVNEYYRGVPNHRRIENLNVDFDAELEKVWPAQMPHSPDPRHPDDKYHKDLRQYLNGIGLGYGRHHFGIWTPRGPELDPMHMSPMGAPWCNYETQDTRGGDEGPKRAAREQAARQYMEQMLATEVALGAVYKAVNPKSFRNAREHRDCMVNEGTGLRRNHKLQCHLLVARVVNKSVTNHKDKGDAHGAMAIWTCFGKFDGADVCLPTLQHRVSFLPSDAMVMHASLVEHCVTPFIGHRISVVFASKSDKLSKIKHFDQMTDEEQRKYLRDRKKKEDTKSEALKAVQDAEHACQDKYLSELDSGRRIANLSGPFPYAEDYKMFSVPLNHRKLDDATNAKKKSLAALLACNPTTRRVTEMENTPASIFYQFTAHEKKRYERGQDPFGTDKLPDSLELPKPPKRRKTKA